MLLLGMFVKKIVGLSITKVGTNIFMKKKVKYGS